VFDGVREQILQQLSQVRPVGVNRPVDPGAERRALRVGGFPYRLRDVGEVDGLSFSNSLALAGERQQVVDKVLTPVEGVDRVSQV